MKKVVMYGRHSKKPLFVGTEEECLKWIFSQASDNIKYIKEDGTEAMLVREVHAKEGIAYDVGQPVMYQIVEAKENETKGIYNN